MAIAAVLVLLAALVLARPALVPASLVLLGTVYGGQLAYDDALLDVAVAGFAAGVLVTAELAYWSLEARERLEAEPGAELRRVALLALHGIGALLVAGTLLALVDALRTSGGLAIDLVGAVAAVAALAAVVVLARRQAQ